MSGKEVDKQVIIQRLRELPTPDNEEDGVNLDGIRDIFDKVGKVVPMVADSPQFDTVRILVGILRGGSDQQLKLSANTLGKLMWLVEKVPFENREKQIVPEILFTMSKVDGYEYFKAMMNTEETADKMKISALFDNNISGALCEVIEMVFSRSIRTNERQRPEASVDFGWSETTAHFRQNVERVGVDWAEYHPTTSRSDHQVDGHLRIPKISNLLGITLRDGFAIFPGSMVGFGSKGLAFRAQVTIVGIYQMVHFVARTIAHNYGFSTPTSNVQPGCGTRHDP